MAGVEIDEEESKRLVKVYRDVNEKVIELWRDCENALHDIASWPELKKPYYLGQHQCLLVTQEGIKLPNGLFIKYRKLRLDTTETRPRFLYKSRRGEVSIWGGSVVENVVQALARIIVGEQMLEVNKKYRPVLTVHDAAVCVVPEDEVESAQEYIMNVMSTPPNWAKGLPVACEASYGDSYGEC